MRNPSKEAVKSLLKRVGVSKVNQPKATPNHPSKSHVVVASYNKGGDRIVETTRVGEQGAETNKTPEQRKAFRDRHRKNIDRGPESAAYWANKVKWKGK